MMEPVIRWVKNHSDLPNSLDRRPYSPGRNVSDQSRGSIVTLDGSIGRLRLRPRGHLRTTQANRCVINQVVVIPADPAKLSATSAIPMT